MKKVQRLLIITLSLVLVSTSMSFAGEQSVDKEKIINRLHTSTNKLASVTDDEEEWIKIDEPEDNSTWYIGEKFTSHGWFCSTWKYYNTAPTVFIYSEDVDFYDVILLEDWDDYIEQDDEDWEDYNFWAKLYTKYGYKPGEYIVAYMPMPCDDFGDFAEGWEEWDDIPCAVLNITIKKLKPPKDIELLTDKKSVEIIYNETSGATSYEIYKSTKKKSGYKKLKATSASYYVDKKVKKGKTYYYKVRTVRNVHGKIKSSFSSPKKIKFK